MTKTILSAVIASSFMFCFAGMPFAQELTITIMDCPRAAKAGQDLSGTFRVQVKNEGKAAVKNAQVDVVLKKDATCPAAGRPAVFSPDYFDGVLLREGRHYVSPDAGETITYRPSGANTIPLNTPVGRSYFLCAVIASGGGEKGGDKTARCACCPIKITGTEERPEISGAAETCAMKGGTATILGRNFGTGADKAAVLTVDGMTIDLAVISWGDGAITVRIPDDTRIRDGKQYQLDIRKGNRTEVLSNPRALSVCPARKPPEAPVSVPPPVPPFFAQ